MGLELFPMPGRLGAIAARRHVAPAAAAILGVVEEHALAARIRAAAHAPQFAEDECIGGGFDDRDDESGERAGGIRRRAQQQPAGAAAALIDARRVRAALRMLAERGPMSDRVRVDGLAEINRVLGRSAGTRRVEVRTDGTFYRSFVPVGDAFAGLVIPIVESAADALILGELWRVRRCADPRCQRVFFDNTKNGRRRWCDMATCGNRAKAARHRMKLHA